MSIGDLVAEYENKLISILDEHAPVKMKIGFLRPAVPWLTPEIRVQKIERWRCERMWRTTRLTVHRVANAEQSMLVNNLISRAKTTFYSELIGSCGYDQKELFRIV